MWGFILVQKFLLLVSKALRGLAPDNISEVLFVYEPGRPLRSSGYFNCLQPAGRPERSLDLYFFLFDWLIDYVCISYTAETDKEEADWKTELETLKQKLAARSPICDHLKKGSDAARYDYY